MTTCTAKYQKPDQPLTLKMVGQYHIREKWKDKWDKQYPTSPDPTRAQYLWRKDGIKLYRNLTRAQGSLAIQLRSGKLGLRAYLFQVKARDITSSSCPCGWRFQTIKHVLFYCPKYLQQRAELWTQIPNTDLRTLLADKKYLKAITRWMIKHTVIAQYATASTLQAQIDQPPTTTTTS